VKRYEDTDDPRVHGHRRGGSGPGLLTRARQLLTARTGTARDHAGERGEDSSPGREPVGRPDGEAQ
jgi:hypothetical protein